MKIGALARHTGITAKTIRYYEEIGLMAEPERAANGYRDYPEDAVDRLAFIRDAQATGLSLSEIASILDLRGQGETTCHHVVDLLERHVDALTRHISNLQKTRRKLAELTQRAQSLDPANCQDPNRCQTIAAGIGREVRARVPLSGAPAPHKH